MATDPFVDLTFAEFSPDFGGMHESDAPRLVAACFAQGNESLSVVRTADW